MTKCFKFSLTRLKLKRKSRRDENEIKNQQYFSPDEKNLTQSLARTALIRLANIEDILCTLVHIISISAVVNIACLRRTQ